MLPFNKPKILADANIPYKLLQLLTKHGFDLITPLFRAKDPEIIELANRENRVILTFDRHFGNIFLFPPEKSSGIVFIRIRPPLIASVFSSLMKLFNSIESSEFKGKLYVLSLSGFRVFPKPKE